MSDQAQSLYEAIIALPEQDRVILIQRLLATLSPEDKQIWEDEWAAELERRHADFEKGTANPIPWDDLKKQLSR